MRLPSCAPVQGEQGGAAACLLRRHGCCVCPLPRGVLCVPCNLPLVLAKLAPLSPLPAPPRRCGRAMVFVPWVALLALALLVAGLAAFAIKAKAASSAAADLLGYLGSAESGEGFPAYMKVGAGLLEGWKLATHLSPAGVRWACNVLGEEQRGGERGMVARAQPIRMPSMEAQRTLQRCISQPRQHPVTCVYTRLRRGSPASTRQRALQAPAAPCWWWLRRCASTSDCARRASTAAAKVSAAALCFVDGESNRLAASRRGGGVVRPALRTGPAAHLLKPVHHPMPLSCLLRPSAAQVPMATCCTSSGASWPTWAWWPCSCWRCGRWSTSCCCRPGPRRHATWTRCGCATHC